LRSWFGDPGKAAFDPAKFKAFFEGFGQGILSVVNAFKSIATLFTGKDADPAATGKFVGQLMALTVALAALGPVLGVLTALVGIIGALAGVARLGGKAVGAVAGEAGAGSGITARLGALFGIVASAPETLLRKGDQEALMKRMAPYLKRRLDEKKGVWTDPPAKSSGPSSDDGSTPVWRQSSEGDWHGLIHKTALNDNLEDLSANVRRLGDRIQFSALGSGSAGSFGGGSAVSYAGSAGGSARSFGGGGAAGMITTAPGQSFVGSLGRRGIIGGGDGGSGSSDNSPIGAYRGKQTFNSLAPRISADLQKDFPGLTKTDTAAILGNLGHESAGMTAFQEGSPRGGGRGGWGWAQWTGPRRRQFEAYAQSRGLDPKSYEANYGFLRHELQTSQKRSISALKGAQGLEGKTVEFEKSFEGAGVKAYGSRIKYARIAAGLPDGQAGVSGPVAAGTTTAGEGAKKSIGDGFTTTGWQKGTSGSIAAKSPSDLASGVINSPSGRMGDAMMGQRAQGTVVHQTINGVNHSPEELANVVQRRLNEATRDRGHDIDVTSI
jgi:hypothetical protein